jgi:hypothetical protein
MLHERLGFSPEIIEAQLAHSVRDSLGRAYNRTEFTEQRREMLQAWADYLDQLRTEDFVAARPAPTGPGSGHSPRALVKLLESSAAATLAEQEVTSASSVVSEVPRDLSTLEASRFLNSSHLFVVQEIEAGRLKCREVGADLRIAMPDLVAYAVEVRLGSGGAASSW